MASALSVTRINGLPCPSERPLTNGRSPTSGSRQRTGSEIHDAPRAPRPTRNVASGEEVGGAGWQLSHSRTTSSPLLSSRCTLANGCVVEPGVELSLRHSTYVTFTGIEISGERSHKALTQGSATLAPRHAVAVNTKSPNAPATNVSESFVARQLRYANTLTATHRV